MESQSERIDLPCRYTVIRRGRFPHRKKILRHQHLKYVAETQSSVLFEDLKGQTQEIYTRTIISIKAELE